MAEKNPPVVIATPDHPLTDDDIDALADAMVDALFDQAGAKKD